MNIDFCCRERRLASRIKCVGVQRTRREMHSEMHTEGIRSSEMSRVDVQGMQDASELVQLEFRTSNVHTGKEELP